MFNLINYDNKSKHYDSVVMPFFGSEECPGLRWR